MLKLYNALTRKVEEFKEINKGVVNMYSCGPTVYSYAHIGNMRAYLFMDALRRVLQFNGYKINGVLNITDVGHLTSDEDEGEDKMLIASKKENKTPWQIADYYTSFFMSQIKKLNIQKPEHIVKATDTIKEMIEMISALIKNGFAYETSKGVYYDVEKFKQYGMLSGVKLEHKLAGARIDVDIEKKHPADFALWVKAPKEHIMQWESPWGMGYPGWHIECSAIGMKMLGEIIDIHTGGIDHLTIHHENEIAQNYGCSLKHIVKRWMHVEFLQIDGGKMSKSLGNIYTIDDLENKGYRALDFRYFSLNAHYSKKQNFTFEALDSAHTSVTRLYEQALLHKAGTNVTSNETIENYKQEFMQAVNQDLNLPLGLSVVWKMLKNEPKSKDIYNLLVLFDNILGLNVANAELDVEIKKIIELQDDVIPGDITYLVEKRLIAKQEKNWALSDQLRQDVLNLGYQIIDTKDGYEIKKLK